MPRKLRVLMLVHEDLIPPESLEGMSEDEAKPVQTEWDVRNALRELGHDVRIQGLCDELLPLRRVVEEWKPHIAFNLLEEFRGQALYDHAVVAYLELLGVPYTGCNPRGLVLTRDKGLAKKLLYYHRIRAPRFMVVRRGRKARRPAKLDFPLIVKSLVEESSTGISQASVVSSDEKLAERVRFVHESIGTDAIVEQYIEGRELTCAVLGQNRLEALPAWELHLGNLPPDAPRIATARVKWSSDYQKKIGAYSAQAEVSDQENARIQKVSKPIFRILEMSGYGRMDFRFTPEGEPYFLEANPNADIGFDEEIAGAAEAAGYAYTDLIQRVLNIGLRRARR
jgi:D-alanine-D-alanine ligase